MAKLSVCPICEQKIELNQTSIKKKNRNYHTQCLEVYENQSKQEARDKEELYKYVCALFDISAVNGLMIQQIKNFHEHYNYKYKGMQLTLEYFYDTLDNSVDNINGLGIIPYCYEDAKEYYAQGIELQEYLEGINKEDFVITKTVHIKSPSIEDNNKRFLIDIESI